MTEPDARPRAPRVTREQMWAGVEVVGLVLAVTGVALTFSWTVSLIVVGLLLLAASYAEHRR